jgi:hypothetical protein
MAKPTKASVLNEQLLEVYRVMGKVLSEFSYKVKGWPEFENIKEISLYCGIPTERIREIFAKSKDTYEHELSRLRGIGESFPEKLIGHTVFVEMIAEQSSIVGYSERGVVLPDTGDGYLNLQTATGVIHIDRDQIKWTHVSL